MCPSGRLSIYIRAMISWAPVNQQYIIYSTCHDCLISSPLAEFASVFPDYKRPFSWPSQGPSIVCVIHLKGTSSPCGIGLGIVIDKPVICHCIWSWKGEFTVGVATWEFIEGSRLETHIMICLCAHRLDLGWLIEWVKCSCSFISTGACLICLYCGTSTSSKFSLTKEFLVCATLYVCVSTRVCVQVFLLLCGHMCVWVCVYPCVRCVFPFYPVGS